MKNSEMIELLGRVFKKKRSANRAEQARLQAAYRAVFYTPVGEDVLEHLCSKYYLSDSSHVAGDPYTSAYNSGQADVIKAIIKFLERDLNTPLQEEAKNE